MSEILLEVKNLTASYGDFRALGGVSLRANTGEVVVLIGANGAGKTTTLRAINGSIRPGAGSEITVSGQRVERLSSSQIVALGVGHVPEGRQLFPNMTVMENVELGSYLPGPRSRRRPNLDRVLGIFPRLRERHKQLAGTLSGGEQQMVAIARALMSEPRLLMLDEPSLGLAPLIVDEIYKTIRQVREQGVTVLLVEQNVGLALRIADRAYVLEEGRVALEGASDVLLGDQRVREAYLGA